MEAVDRLRPILRDLLSDARSAWPGISLSDETYARHLVHVAPDGDDVLAAVQQLRTADLYLASACAEGDTAALRAFEADIMPGARRAAARVDGDPVFIEEVCSDVRVKLLTSDSGPARITGYLGHGPLVHWVQVTAMREAQTRKRRDKSDRYTVLDDLELSSGGGDHELAPLAAQLRAPFGRAFTEALAALSSRERNVLRLHLVDDVSAERIGLMYRVHRATVSRWIAAARRKVYADTRKRLADDAGIERAGFESLMGHVLSGLDLSLASFLQDP